MFIEYVPGTSLKTLHMFLHFILTRSFLLWYSPTCLFLLSLLVLWVLLFSRSVLSVFLQLQNARLPCPSLSPRVCSNSCPLSQWCYPTISSSVARFSPCHQSFTTSESFPMSWPFALRWPKYWSFSFGIVPSSEYSGLISFRTDWFDLAAVQGTLNNLLQHHN